jgi:hypothetical protein
MDERSEGAGATMPLLTIRTGYEEVNWNARCGNMERVKNVPVNYGDLV